MGKIATAREILADPRFSSDWQRSVELKRCWNEHLTAMSTIQRGIEGRGGGDWLASERRAWDAHEDSVRELSIEYERLQAEQVDPSTVIDASRGIDAPFEDAPNWGGRRGWDMQGRVTRGELVYRPDLPIDDVRSSWLKDMIRSSEGDPEARNRLIRNNRESGSEFRALAGNIAGAVGEFVPPVYLTQQLVRVARAGRVYADQINGQPLTVKTNSINIPRLVSGTAIAKQATENSAVQNTDATSDSISATVATLAGQQVVSVQLLDQSPISMDEVILGDLASELAVQVDKFALSSNATGMTGILNLSGTNAVAYTDTTPTTVEIYPKIADAIQRISTTRFMPPDKIFMHPRRWAWFSSALDSTNRPLVVPNEQHPMNSMAAQGGVVAEGFVGSIQGIPIFTDPNIPTNLGGATNQDPIIVTRSSDSYLWESPQTAIVDRFSLSQQLSVRLILHAYVAVQHARYPVATSIVNGTGLVAPTF